MERGTVKFFNPAKGFGFIVSEAAEDIFFHKTDVKNAGFRSVLYEGDAVEYEVREGEKGKRAYRISRV